MAASGDDDFSPRALEQAKRTNRAGKFARITADRIPLVVRGRIIEAIMTLDRAKTCEGLMRMLAPRAQASAALEHVPTMLNRHCEPTGPARSGRPDDKLREAIQSGLRKLLDCFLAPSGRLAMTALMQFDRKML